MSRFTNWLVASSADPNKLAMTVKGSLVAAIPVLLIVLKILNVDSVGGPELEATIDLVSNFIISVFSLISAVMMLFGGVRKIYYLAMDRS